MAAAQSDMKSISYFLAVPGAPGLAGAAGDLLASAANSVPSLARLEGPRLTLAHANATADLQTLASMVHVLAGEVTLLGFRYCDGLAWYETWDSTQLGALPNAVEITLGFSESSNPVAAAPQPAGSIVPTRLYRYVVSLPTAEPYVATE
jgi:hypothetical protein